MLSPNLFASQLLCLQNKDNILVHFFLGGGRVSGFWEVWEVLHAKLAVKIDIYPLKKFIM